MATFTIYSEVTLFAWLISHQPAVLFSQNEPATSNQSAVLFSQKKSAPAISHQPTETGCKHVRGRMINQEGAFSFVKQKPGPNQPCDTSRRTTKVSQDFTQLVYF
jgi:hypothetical protein